MKKKITTAVTLMMVLILSVTAFANINFSDVKYGDWYYEAVDYVNEYEIMIGISETEFKPDTEMTRAMAVTVLARLAHADTESITESTFEDIDIKKWYGPCVEWARTVGIVKGVSETEFKPDGILTREQVCLMLSNFFDYLKLSTSNAEKESFADEDEISDWARSAVIRMQRAGIVNGRTDNNFEPQGSCKRAEFAQIVLNSSLAQLTIKCVD